jgi:D-tyrosyl-tRNA(Tyr) deacylase
MMIALIQRVTRASVAVDGAEIGTIGRGILALVGIAGTDGASQSARMLEKVLTYRIFPDEAGKMNLSLRQIGGGLLLVPQFTLLADTSGGTRPGFSASGPPEQARALFETLVERARATHPAVACGRFGAHMQVSLVNDGPVTFWLEAS